MPTSWELGACSLPWVMIMGIRGGPRLVSLPGCQRASAVCGLSAGGEEEKPPRGNSADFRRICLTMGKLKRSLQTFRRPPPSAA